MHRASNRALKHRNIYIENQATKRVLKYLRLHFALKKKKTPMFHLLSFKTKLNIKSKSIIKDACIFSGRSRGLTAINVSRFNIRELMLGGGLKGLKKYY
jgi:ribosomal protein S14